MIKDAIAKLVDGHDLKKDDAYQTMNEIMTGQATPSQIAGFLVALRNKGETVDEIAGCALAMRDAAHPMTIKQKVLVDCCGTGGDGQHSLNISTAAAFVAAGAGLVVAKHGNRSISSKCGSADVLERLGVNVNPPSFVVEKSIDEVGIGFMLASSFHPAMKYAMPARKELGIRTIFNLLGPLTNPAKAKVQMIGVYEKSLTSVLAQVMARMGHQAGLVVHSHGWDEITLDGPTHVAETLNGKVKTYSLTHKNFGLPKVSVRNLRGGDADENALVIKKILEGREHPARSVIVANAAALIWIAERARGKKTYALKDAVLRADAAVTSGRALQKLQQMVKVSHTVHP